jgi:hypothetical protein
LRPRLRVDRQVDNRILDRLVRRRPLARANREDQALPAHRRVHPGLETQGLSGHLVQRLDDGDVVAVATDRGCDRLLGHLFLGRHGRRDILGVHRSGGDGRRRGDGGGRRLFGGRTRRRRRGLRRCGRGRRRGLSVHDPRRQQRAQRDAQAGATQVVRRDAVRAHRAYSGVQAS